MYRKRQHIMGLSICIFMLMSLVAACAPVGAPATSDGGAAAAERPKLTVWLNLSLTPEADVRVKELVEQYGEENGIDIDLVQDNATVLAPKWDVALETKQLPDIAEMTPDQPAILHNAGVLLDVSDVVARLGERGGGYIDGALDAVTFDGAQYGVPTRVTSMVMHVRKDLVDAQGETLPDTWEDVVRVGEAVTDLGNVWGWGHALGMASKDAEVHTLSILLSYGASYYGEDGKTPSLNTPGAIQVLNLIKDAWDANVIPQDSITWDDAGNNRAYQTRSVAMAYNPASILVWAKQNDDDLYQNTTIVPVPAGPNGRFASGYVYSMAAFNTSAHPELAKGLMEYIMDPANYESVLELAGANFIPTINTLRDPANISLWEDTENKTIMDYAQYTVPLGYPGPTTLWVLEAWNQNIVTWMFNKVLVDNMSPEDAAVAANERLQEIYDSFQ